MRTVSQELGQWGEATAADWLVARGWTVVERQFRAGHRDIDLIIQRDMTIAFVEVKTRRDARFGDPIEAVDYRKRRELVRSARAWLAHHRRNGMEYRFDVVGILYDGARTKVSHIENAFWC